MKMLSGYFILKNENTDYRGVDRTHFEPGIFENLTDLTKKTTSKLKYAWEFYSGWRRDLYKIIEENSIDFEASYLINDEKTAKYINTNIPPSEGKYEIIKVEIFRIDEKIIESKIDQFLGYDLAYLGGDFYSAIKHGLIANPILKLKKGYLEYLNQFGLFSNIQPLIDYLKDFKSEIRSETNSEFHIYALYLIR